jgi:drug/metabolite transporter (DMT)-like permease
MRALRIDPLPITFVLVWSSGYVVGALATEVMAPLAVTLWRFAVAAAVLGALALARRETWPRGRDLATLGAIGVLLFAVQFGALYSALADGMPAGTTALIACSSPLLVAVIGGVTGGERLTAKRWAGVALGVVGVAVTLSDRVGRPPSATALLWALLGLGALAGGTVLQSRLRTAAGPSALATVELVVATAVLAVWAPLRGTVDLPFTAQGVGTFAWLSLVTGVGAPLLLFALIRRRGATGASSLLFVVPAVTALAAWPILGTPVGVATVAGVAVVAVALRLVRSGSAGGGLGALQRHPAGVHQPELHRARRPHQVEGPVGRHPRPVTGQREQVIAARHGLRR